MFLRKFDTNFHTVWTLVRCHVPSRNAPTGNTPMQQKRKAFISINLVAAFRKPDKMNVLLHIHVFPQPPTLPSGTTGRFLVCWWPAPSFRERSGRNQQVVVVVANLVFLEDFFFSLAQKKVVLLFLVGYSELKEVSWVGEEKILAHFAFCSLSSHGFGIGGPPPTY